MALSRWSHSAWYIYEAGSDDEPALCIQCCGTYTLSELKEYLPEILEKIYEDFESLSSYDRMELREYLKSWTDFNTLRPNLAEVMVNQAWTDFNAKIVSLRRRGAFRYACMDPSDREMEHLGMFYKDLRRLFGD